MWDIFIFYLAPHDQFPRMMTHVGYIYIPSGTSFLTFLGYLDHLVYPTETEHVLTFLCTLN